jgi:dCMP deaminase
MDPRRFMVDALAAASKSKDPSTKVGAVILDADSNLLASGWNGFARGVKDSEERLCHRPTKYRLMVHAEMNAVLASARTGRRLDGATIVVSSLFPCEACASAIVQAGIKLVIAPKPNNDRWLESNQWAMTIFDEAGVKVEYVD